MATLALLIALQAGEPAPRPTVAVPRIEAELRVDGVLDEEAWSRAARLNGFHQYQPVDGRPAEEATEVLVFYTPSALCFGIVAHTRVPGSVRATVADRDKIDQDDNVTLFLDTFLDRRRAFFFAVNPLGVQQDGVRTEGIVSPGQIFGGETDKNPDFAFDSKGRIGADGYVVEIRIPFKSLRYPGGSAPLRFGLNAMRRTQRTGYVDTWTDVRRASASFLAQSGTLEGFQDLRRGMVVELQPFLTVSADGARDPSGVFERASPDPSAGANLRLGVTPDVSLDATLNPDFSQVESDAGLVTVNERFALFFPEKRPFFLEGIELFATPNQLVYTRRIVDPLAGGKLTAKRGRLNLAHLTALDEVAGEHALFNVTRVRTDFGESSTAGLTFTNRSQGERRNTVLAADTRYVFGKLYFLQGQIGGSQTTDVGAATHSAPLWLAEFDRTGRAWGFNYRAVGVGDGFDSQAGFVPRSDIVGAQAYNRGTLYGRRGALVESFTVYAGPGRIWRYGDLPGGAPLEGSTSADFMAQLRGGWQARGHVARQFVHYAPRDYASYSVASDTGPTAFAPQDVEKAWGFFLGGTTPAFRRLDADAQIAWGRVAIFPEASQGHESRLAATLNLRGGPTLRAGAQLTLSRITRADASEFARTVIPRLKVEYQPRRWLFARIVVQLEGLRRDALRDPVSGWPLLVEGAPSPRRDSKQLRVDALASYEPTPGTVAFLGYGASLDDVQAERPTRGPLTRASEGFFLKLAYRFRR
jgi:hypothetical protein